uniref:TATA box-binding protein-associated factor RNA polymerase I subunit B n=1 Tax=Strongyloides papillosus TaxID=174720 RepID=A0A0N5B6L1_STREA
MSLECANCRSSDFYLEDGYYCCKECGAQTDAVDYQEVVTNVHFSHSAGKDAKEKVVDEKKSSKVGAKQQYFGRSFYNVDDFNECLDRIGTRLASSTQIIYSICSVLVEKCGASEDLYDVCMGLFQKYLATYKVAFCKEELNDGSEEIFSIQIRLKERELNRLIKERQKQANELMEKEINDRLMNLDLFGPIGNVEERERRQVDNFNITLKPEDYYRVRETSVSKKALTRAGHIYLNLDMLIAIIYMSLVYTGTHFIQMADLLRWQREGRFPVTQDHINDIQIVNYDNTSSTFKVQHQICGENLQKTNSSPLSKCNYSSMFLWQFLSLPRLVLPLDSFDELVGRYIYDLNLPKSFGSRIQEYRKIFNPLKNQNCDLWKEYFPLIDNCVDVVESQFTTEKGRNDSSNFYKITLPKTFVRQRLVDTSFIDIPIEVKAMALILFAIKQEFSFNNKDEFEKPNDNDCFYFVDWLKQLNFRTQLADGKSVDYVTSERNLYTFKCGDKKVYDHRGYQLSYMFNDQFDSKFDHQIPSKSRMFMNQKLLADGLEGVNYVPRESNNDGVLFTPIKFYGEECICENSLEHNDTVLLIKKDFSNYKLKDFKDIEEKGHYLFPPADGVNCLSTERKFNGEETRCSIYFSTQNLLTVYESIRDSLPKLFNQLLYLLSKVIGEWPHILYFAFLAVENAIVYREEFELFKTFLINNNGVVIGKHQKGNYCVAMYLNNSEGNFFDLKIKKYVEHINYSSSSDELVPKHFQSFSNSTIPHIGLCLKNHRT